MGAFAAGQVVIVDFPSVWWYMESSEDDPQNSAVSEERRLGEGVPRLKASGNN